MRQLLSPNEPLLSIVSSTKLDQQITSAELVKNKEDQLNRDIEKQNEKSNTVKRNIGTDINVKEIHERIMNHIVNLNRGRRKNFINANSTGLDTAIQEIQKQKRLELSRVLRHMCSSEAHDSKGSGELIDSIIPDLGVRIEELPLSVIEELRATLNSDFNEGKIRFYYLFMSNYSILDIFQDNAPSTMFPPSDSTSEEQIEVKIEVIENEAEIVEITKNDVLDTSQENVCNYVNNSSCSLCSLLRIQF